MDARQPVRLARPDPTYTVSYGCDAWHASDDARPRAEAWILFHRYSSNPPALNGFQATYANITDDRSGRVMEMWAAKTTRSSRNGT